MSERLGAARRRPLERARNDGRRVSVPAPAQGGYALLIVLIAVAIVAYLARDSIMQMVGALNRSAPMTETRLPPGAQPAGDATQATPLHAAPVERARAVEDTVRQQFEQTGKRIDAPR